MATSGRGSGVVGYSVQVAVDTAHNLIVVHDVINVGNDCSQLLGTERPNSGKPISPKKWIATRGPIEP